MESRRTPEQEVAELFRLHQRRLTLIAFRILGQWQLAEDAVSEAFARLLQASPENPAAWLTTVTTRQALDAATTAERQRVDYIGTWLPDAVATEDDHEFVDPALVRLLQSLPPMDRALVVLADVLGYTTSEIADVVGSTPAAVRQRLSRARKAVRGAANVRGADPDTVTRLAGLLYRGELATFVAELSEGVVLWTDSGGFSTAARNPVVGKDRVTRFFVGIIRKYGMPELSVRQTVGGAAVLARSADVDRWIVLESDGARITGIQIQQNQGKLFER